MSTSARQQVAINVGFTLLKSGFVLLSIRLADVMLTAQMMGLLLLFRRQGALWSNLAQLGLSQVLLKYYAGSDDPVYRARLWQRAVRWVALAMLASSLLCLLAAEPLSQWLFPTSPVAVTAAFGVYVAGLALGFIANSSWLAEFRFAQSNLIDWLHGSLLFVLCLLFANDWDVAAFSWLLAFLTVAVAVISLLRFSRQFGYRVYVPDGGWSLTPQERRYGVSRALTAYADMATMVLGPWLLRDQLVDAAHLITAYTVLRIAQTLVMPLAQVLSLRANSKLYNSFDESRRILLMSLVVFICACGVVGGYLFLGDFFIKWWLPNSSSGVIEMLDDLMWYVPGVCVFYALRSYIDLRYEFPWNLTVFVAGLFCFSSFCFFSTEIGVDEVLRASELMFSLFYIYAAVAIFSLIKERRREFMRNKLGKKNESA